MTIVKCDFCGEVIAQWSDVRPRIITVAPVSGTTTYYDCCDGCMRSVLQQLKHCSETKPEKGTDD